MSCWSEDEESRVMVSGRGRRSVGAPGVGVSVLWGRAEWLGLAVRFLGGPGLASMSPHDRREAPRPEPVYGRSELIFSVGV